MGIRSKQNEKKKLANKTKRERPIIDLTDIMDKKPKPASLNNMNRRLVQIRNQTVEQEGNVKFAGVLQFHDYWPNHNNNNNRGRKRMIEKKRKPINNYRCCNLAPHILENRNTTKHNMWLSMIDRQLKIMT